MKKVLFIIMLSLMFIVGAAENTFACSCRIDDKPVKTQVKEAYQESTAIFSGEVIEIMAKDDSTLIIKIKVAKSWKSNVAKIISINTAKESSMCGYSFEIGKKYLVYANGSKNELSTNNCSRTAIFGDKQEIRFLDRLKRTKGKSA